MSHIALLAADHPLPLTDPEAAAVPGGFRVLPHEYYRDAEEGLNLKRKPFACELDMEESRSGLDALLAYLRKNLAPGEEAELWSLWVGDGGGERPRHYRGRLEDFDLETLELLTGLQYEPDLTGEFPEGLICQVCLTVER